jgi:DNA-directed RNA polymerase subunit M/transcription elongation factor TFIIS
MMFLRPQAVAKFGGKLYSTCLRAAFEAFEELKMRQRWTGKEVLPKQTQSECPRCGAWSSAERCPQCGAHRLSTEFSQVRIEDRPKVITTGR